MERSRDKKTEPRPKFHIATLIEVMGILFGGVAGMMVMALSLLLMR
ncbi:hypothetical protein H206_01839 [Candidatus Electrothrix aarhusensis]|jgi:hypothetical protein|uniref:Uncharacterized protein n=1 Tax=Candidatus Electrothrix aarhusensis TaxID=1859131 RepID=A0A3S3R4T7_9BACT|nr:hypothetical protein H206_01839 [Candidatus Electrothrix aarhusensis]